MDDTTIRVMRLAGQGLYCSQIIMALALETCGRENPEMVRSLAGLAYGCGAGAGTCGALSGAACVLAFFSARRGPGQEESPALLTMLEELNDWFAASAGGRDGATTCQAIAGDGMDRIPQPKCGQLVADAFAKVVELLVANGFDPADPDASVEF